MNCSNGKKYLFFLCYIFHVCMFVEISTVKAKAKQQQQLHSIWRVVFFLPLLPCLSWCLLIFILFLVLFLGEFLFFCCRFVSAYSLKADYQIMAQRSIRNSGRKPEEIGNLFCFCVISFISSFFHSCERFVNGFFDFGAQTIFSCE